LYASRLYAGNGTTSGSSSLNEAALWVGNNGLTPIVNPTIRIWGSNSYPPALIMYTGDNSSIPHFSVEGKKYGSEWYSLALIRTNALPTQNHLESWYGTVDKWTLCYDNNSRTWFKSK
jgi:hypothetical protein